MDLIIKLLLFMPMIKMMLLIKLRKLQVKTYLLINPNMQIMMLRLMI
ncbi:hypothetical protein c7_L147 [Megavirus courdo7]|uniref:Uncharacterized protein n=1 Tax=Megavirus courdo7 TaxID=1128135 RepID=H2E9Z0_9VIRU|nr:hypothetical protein c7_L147 [Megavirus courdo7]